MKPAMVVSRVFLLSVLSLTLASSAEAQQQPPVIYLLVYRMEPFIKVPGCLDYVSNLELKPLFVPYAYQSQVFPTNHQNLRDDQIYFTSDIHNVQNQPQSPLKMKTERTTSAPKKKHDDRLDHIIKSPKQCKDKEVIDYKGDCRENF